MTSLRLAQRIRPFSRPLSAAACPASQPIKFRAGLSTQSLPRAPRQQPASIRSNQHQPAARIMSSSSSSSSSGLHAGAGAASLSSDPDVERVLSFWFDGDPSRWFQGGPAFDTQCTAHETLVARARRNELRAWEDAPGPALALILLLDQFPRNIFRGSAQAHASDAQACALAVRCVARGFDRAVGDNLRASFFYLPLEHDETLVSQIACVALTETLVRECAPGAEEREFLEVCAGFARRHRDAILRFGRFPARNKALGRESTEEEKQYLEENPEGF